MNLIEMQWTASHFNNKFSTLSLTEVCNLSGYLGAVILKNLHYNFKKDFYGGREIYHCEHKSIKVKLGKIKKSYLANEISECLCGKSIRFPNGNFDLER